MDKGNKAGNGLSTKSETSGLGGGSTSKESRGRPLDSARKPNIHPLLNANILDNLFKFIVHQPISDNPLKDIKHFRLVNKSWNDSITRLYRRSRAPMAFGSYKIFGLQVPRNYNDCNERFELFVKAMHGSLLLPVQHFKFMNQFFSEQSQEQSSEVFKCFLRTCGPEMASLTLDLDLESCDPTGSSFDLGEFPELNLGNLKKLSFTVSNHAPTISGVTPALGHFLGVILKAAETLEEFEFDFEPFFLSDKLDDDNYMEPFQDGMCKNIPKSVKILRLKTFVKEVTLVTLVEKGIKPDQLELNINANLERSGAIKRFLESQAETLKILRMGPLVFWATPTLEFPRMSGLTELKFELSWGLNVQPFLVSKVFPNLRYLNASGWNKNEEAFEEFLTLNRGKKTGRTLKALSLPWQCPIIRFLKDVANTFPNLKELELSLEPSRTEETLQEVFSCFPNLEQIKITFPLKKELCLEAILSGISKAECDRIKKLSQFDGVNVVGLQRKPSLLNLAKLGKLEMEIEYCSFCVNVSDFLAHFVFLKMGGLRELCFSESKSKLTPRYIDLLQNKLKLTLKAKFD